MRVEGEPVDLGFDANIGTALERVVAGAPPARRYACLVAAKEATDSTLEEVRTVGTGFGRARLPFPKGVFRFRTFEEADAWTEQHILQTALNKARAHPNGAT